MNKYLLFSFLILSKVVICCEMQTELSPLQEMLYKEFNSRTNLRVIAYQSLSKEDQSLLQLAYSDYFNNQDKVNSAIKKFVKIYFEKCIDLEEIKISSRDQLAGKINEMSNILILMKQKMQSDEDIVVNSEVTARMKAIQTLRKELPDLYKRFFKEHFFENLNQTVRAICTWANFAVDYMIDAGLINKNTEFQKKKELFESKKQELTLAYSVEK